MLKTTCLLVCFISSLAFSQQTAQNLFNQYRYALYQIQIIDQQSGKKTAIGSGFRINQQGDIISNYHVIADYVYSPQRYQIQFLDADGHTGPLNLQRFDVINDLSLLRIAPERIKGMPFQLADTLPKQGTDIYSLGNPHDLGMIVVPGTYNGLKSNSFYQRIHFTGSINPGMSGGPAVDQSGQIIGVNVATAGNQIGFLIPLEKVIRLVGQPPQPNNLVGQPPRSGDAVGQPQQFQPSEYLQQVALQLHASQQRMIDRLLDTPWQFGALGKANVPKNVTDFVTCWGSSNSNDKNARFASVANRCRIGESIFLNQQLRTGEVEIEFEWVSSDALNSLQYYNLISQKIAYTRPGNLASENHVTNYQCQQSLTQNQQGLTAKSIVCARAYKDFKNLFDVLFISASNDFASGGLISHFTLAGVSKQSMTRFTKHFMESMSWR